MKSRGFTLIELLIVVAIIAILAAIAVPNFLEAQTRAKVSRVKADMRSAATALESYRIDWNGYPFDGADHDGSGTFAYNYWYLPPELSTPLAYMTSVNLVDPFRLGAMWYNNFWQQHDIRYANIDSTWGTQFGVIQTNPAASTYLSAVREEWGGWRLTAAGPDKSYGPTGWVGVSTYPASPIPYDATNGTVSQGDILRTQVAPTGYKNASS